MHITLIGASGFIGSALLAEALRRGVQVTAIVTHPEKLQPAAGLSVQALDVLDTAALTAALRGQDAVLSAFSGHAQQDIEAYYLRGIRSIIDATRAAGVPRLLVVGGAGSLQVAPGRLLVDTPEFPATYKPTANGARQALDWLRQEPPGLDWTMLSPSAEIFPGERTAKFRMGGDALLVDAQGKSRISVQDFAVAMLDELILPTHPRQRFTVGY